MNPTMNRLLVLLSVLFCFILNSPIAEADDAWEVHVTPYAWLPSIDGDSTVDGQTTELDLSFSDILRVTRHGCRSLRQCALNLRRCALVVKSGFPN